MAIRGITTVGTIFTPLAQSSIQGLVVTIPAGEYVTYFEVYLKTSGTNNDNQQVKGAVWNNTSKALLAETNIRTIEGDMPEGWYRFSLSTPVGGFSTSTNLAIGIHSGTRTNPVVSFASATLTGGTFFQAGPLISTSVNPLVPGTALNVQMSLRCESVVNFATTGAPPPPTNPSGVAPPVGDLNGWRQVFLEDFTTDITSWGDCTDFSGGQDCSLLPAVYRSKFWAYPNSYADTRQKDNGDGGYYHPANMSVSGSMLRIPLRRTGGVSQSNAPIPKFTGSPQTYGRYTVRFKSDSSSTFKVAWLLWREVASWGEIDFPEADLNGIIVAFNHHQSGQAEFDSSTVFGNGAWHTSVVEWIPNSVKFFLNGVLIGEDTGANVPSTAMTWVLQSETNLGGTLPANAPEANIYIDWMAIWARDGSAVAPPPPTGGAPIIAPTTFTATVSNGNQVSLSVALPTDTTRTNLMVVRRYASPNATGVDPLDERGVVVYTQAEATSAHTVNFVDTPPLSGRYYYDAYTMATGFTRGARKSCATYPIPVIRNPVSLSATAAGTTVNLVGVVLTDGKLNISGNIFGRTSAKIYRKNTPWTSTNTTGATLVATLE